MLKHTIAQLPYIFAALSFYYYVHRCLMMTNIIIVPVLAFTWIIGLFAVGGQEKIYAILFVLANVLRVKVLYKMFQHALHHLNLSNLMQRLIIFLLYVVLHEKMFKWIKGRRSNSKMRVSILSSLVYIYPVPARCVKRHLTTVICHHGHLMV